IQKLLSSKKTSQSQLPFVSLKGRSDYTVIFYAANIYPEHIRAGLNKKEFFSKLTGKFVMRKGYLKNMDEFLEINIELAPSIKSSQAFEKALQAHIIKKLKEMNMEYKFLGEHLEKDIRPRIVLWPYQHEKHFKLGLKPKYI